MGICVFSSVLSCPASKIPPRLMLASVLLHSALPAEFIGRLRSKEATEGSTVTLCCELSKAAPVEWRKGSETLRAGDRVSLRQDGAVCELEIRELVSTDAGEYSCVCGQERTSALLTVTGKDGLAGSSGSLCVCPCLLCSRQPRWAPVSSVSCAALSVARVLTCQTLCSVSPCLGSALQSGDLRG